MNIKKYGKLITFVFIAFIFSISPVFAREMSLDELGEKIVAEQPKARYAYIIGDYVFTSEYTLQTQDLMLAARSIKNAGEGKENLDKMVVYRLTREMNGFEYGGWKVDSNALGSGSTLELDNSGHKINIRYIDYKFEPEKTEAEVNVENLAKTYTDILAERLHFQASESYENGKLTIADGKVTGLLLKNSKITLSPEDQAKFHDPKYFFAYVLEVPNATSKTKVTRSGLGRVEGTIAWEDFDVTPEKQNGDTPGIVVLMPITPEDIKTNPILTITVDLDGDSENEYEPTNYTLDLSGLRFQEESKATIGYDENEISEEDKTTLTDWGYTLLGENKHYQIQQKGQEANAYQVTGKVEPQHFRAGTFNSTEENGYFFIFNLKKPEELATVPEGVKVTVQGQQTITYGKEYFNDLGVFTDLFKLNESCGDSCTIKITVDWDGEEGKAYLNSQEITIDYKDLTFVKGSNSSIKKVEDVNQASETLKNGYGWEKPDNYNIDFATTGTNVKVTGLLPIYNKAKEKLPFKEEHLTDYYIAFAIQTNTNAQATTTVNITDGEETILWKQENFDTGDTIYMLKHLHSNTTDKTFTVVIDMDGDGEEYSPYTLTFDWSALKLQERTIANVSASASDADKQSLTDYGYNPEANSNLAISGNDGTYLVNGKLTQQVLNDNVFAEKTGYYFDFTFQLPENVDIAKVQISHLKTGSLGINDNIKKTFKENAYDKTSHTLTILYQFTEDPQCNKNVENCKIYYSVDYDGDGNEYLPTLVTIDYSKLTFEKSSLFEVKALNRNDNNTFEDDGWLDKEGYSIKVESDKLAPNKYKVSGVLPIFTDEEWQKDNDPLGSIENDYYLGLLLKLVNAPEGFKDEDGKLSIKILDSEGKDSNHVTKNDFGTAQSIYILKYLVPSDESKEFTITVDLDGEGEEYAPYNVTIDYSKLEFQNYSFGNDFDILKEGTLSEGSPEKKDLDSYHFDPKTVQGVSIETSQAGGGDREPSKTGLQGSIKEQTLQNAFDDNNGYFVPIKISVPKEEEWFAKYKKKWTITLNTENNGPKTYTPSDAEYEQGWVLVLFKLDKNKTEVKYKIDFDGNGDAFLPTEYTIKYDKLNFQTENQITFNYFDETTGKVVTTTEKVYQGETIDPAKVPALSNKKYTYHTFDYWYDAAKQPTDPVDLNSLTTKEDENLTLKAHWTLDVDKFLEDVVLDLASSETDFSQDFSSHFDVTKTDTTITFNVKNPESKLSVLNDTSIPGAIAYILQRGEIQDITLSSGGKKVVFTKDGVNNEVQPMSLDEEGTALKGKIQAGAKALFTELLQGEGGEEAYTLNNMVAHQRTFNITVGTLDPSVKLANADKTSYEFKFESDIVNVSSEDLLKSALQGPSKTIYISSSFSVAGPIDVNRKVDITGADAVNLTSSNEEPIFQVTNNEVKIENLGLKAGENTKTLINVENNGNLTASNLTITPADGENKLEAAIEVKEGGNLAVTDLKYEKEHYNNPAVRAAEGNAVVKLTDTTGRDALAKEKETISVNDTGNDTKAKDSSYHYKNYYNKPENSMIYRTELYNYQAGSRLTIIKYNYYGENVKVPTIDRFTNFTYDGETYELFAFTKKSYNVLRSDTTIQSDDVKKDELKVTSDGEHYWAVYKVTLMAGIKKVNNSDDFKEAVTDGSTTAIYVSPDTSGSLTIDYTDQESFKIEKNLSIIGPSNLKVTIKAKKIEISEGANVLMNRINLEVSAQEKQEALIDVQGSKFSLWQSTLNNTGIGVDYAIKYNNQQSVVDVRFMGRGSQGFLGSINKAYIYVAGKMAAGSDLFSNEFKSNTGQKMAAIIIDGFAADAIVQDGDDGEPDIRFENNNVLTNYAIVFTKKTSGQKADIKLGNSKIKVGIQYGDSEKSFGGIALYTLPSNVDIVYIDSNQLESTSKPEGLTSLTFKSLTAVGDSISETASINGLTKNEDGTYSGLVTQSVDGKFYLPLTLVSDQFEDRKSKITVTDPNNQTQDYLYSEYSEDGIAPISTLKLMKINLEALKTAKVKDGNKEYAIQIDYDGDGQEDDHYTVNYNDVKTEEEIVLEAVKNTIAADNYTFKKDNRIKDGVEKFTSQFDKGKYYDLYTDGQNTQYSFRLRNLVSSHKGPIVITVEKAEEGYTCTDHTCKPVINGWKFSNFFSQVSMGSHELSLLQDVMQGTTVETDAIKKVERSEKEHTFIVTLNTERLNEWLNNAYLDSQKVLEDDKDKDASQANEASVQLEVVLDAKEQYLVSFKTLSDFNIVSNGHTYTNNRINVQYEKIGTTTIQDPKMILGHDGQPVTEEEILKFYEDCKAWHHYSTGATIYEED